MNSLPIIPLFPAGRCHSPRPRAVGAGQQDSVGIPLASSSWRLIVMWNLFGKGNILFEFTFGGVRAMKGAAMCATPPGTKACDAVGEGFRPKWREG